jgi:hypothetical protein
MPEKIGEVIPKGVRIPQKIIERIGDVLDRSIVRESWRKEMPEGFQNKERTFDKRVVADEELVVPNQLSLERRKADCNPKDRKQQTTDPILLEIPERSMERAPGCG